MSCVPYVVLFFGGVVCLIISGIVKLFKLFFWWLFLPFSFHSCPFSPSYGFSLGVRGGPLSTFHLGLPQPHLYLRIPFTLRQKMQVVSHLPLDRLVQTHLTLLHAIYFCFSLNDVLSASPMVVLLDTKTLELGFGNFYQEIGGSFKWNILFKVKRLL
jgi:hypothetical protein